MQRKEITFYNKKGADYFINRKYDLAIKAFTKAIEAGSEDELTYAKIYFNRGCVYYQQKKYELALADFTKAIELNPEFAAAYNNRGLSYAEIDNYHLAIADLEKVIELHSNTNPYSNLSVYGNLGYAYYGLGNFELALLNFNKVIALTQNYEKIYMWRARVQPELVGSILDYLKAIDLEPHNKDAADELKDLLANRHEMKIYHAILTQSDAVQIYLIKQCLNPKTLLGKRFYGTDFTEENFYYLDMLAERLNQIEPYLTVVSVTAASIFKAGEHASYVAALQADRDYLYSNKPESKEYTPTTSIGFHCKL